VLDPSGEGKTTLLMRTAWELSQAGFIILWEHHGYVTAPYRHAFQGERRLVICLNGLPWVENLLGLVSNPNESGLPFVLLGTARQNEWENSGLEAQLGRLARLQRFPLGRLTPRREVGDLLTRLEAHQVLGALERLPPAQLEPITRAHTPTLSWTLGAPGWDPLQWKALHDAFRLTLSYGRGHLGAVDWGRLVLEPHQLVPLRRIVSMPFSRLFLADDSGLGKAAEEAGKGSLHAPATAHLLTLPCPEITTSWAVDIGIL